MRCPRRADARAHGGVAPGHLAADAQDRDLRDPQPARGALPLDAGRRHDGAPRADQVGARSVDGLPALDGVARARRAAREALGRDPRGVAAGDAVRVVAARGALLVALLVLWEIVGRASNPLLSVPPSAVLPALRDLLLLRSYPDLPASVLLTLREIAVAYGLAVVAGLACGFALGFNRLIGSAYGPMLAALYAVPAVVWYPSLMLFFGLDAASKIAFGFLLGFFPVTLAVLAGIRQVNPHLVTVARAYGAGPFTVFGRVMVPAMLFTLVGALRARPAAAVPRPWARPDGLAPGGRGRLDPPGTRPGDGAAARAPAPAVGDTAAPPASRPPLQYRVRALQLVTIGLALGVWETAARAGWIDPLFVPAPGAVGAALGTIGGTALAALGDTLGKTAIAYVLSVTLGVAAGLTVGSVRLLREVLNPFVIALYSLPKILVLPWIVLLLGYGTAPAVLYGTIHGVFPVTVLVIGAVRDVDRTLVTVARAYGATTWQLYWKVLLPAIVPSVVAGMRLGIVFCLLGVLVVEMFAGVRGMGYVMSSLANGFRAPELFAATALVSAASIAIVLVLDHVNERLSHWRG